MSSIGSVEARPYGYSFDRENFDGEFATREQALEAGLKAAERRGGMVEAVFVGKRVAVDPQAELHADEIVRSMKRRMLSKTGDATFLTHVNEHVLADLDAALAKTIVEWLKRHELTPAASVRSISEHAMPTVRGHAPDRRAEVQFIGPEE